MLDELGSYPDSEIYPMATTFTLPATQTAIVLGEADRPLIKRDSPCPKLSSNQIVVRTKAVALNPSDTKMKGGFAVPYGVLGADFAGTVVDVGSDVTEVAIGDTICGAQNIMFNSTPEQAAFAEYNWTRGGIWMKVPNSYTIEAAASLPVGVSTAGLAMKLLGIPLPGEPATESATVLVYGGSTATATIAMQLLRLSGYTPIATCSPKHFDLAKSNGAEEVFDYRDVDCAEKIRRYTKNNLKYALDCIVNVESTTACFKAIGRAGGKYVSLDPFPTHAASRKVVHTDFVVGPLIFGEGCTWPEPYGRPPSEDLRQYGIKLWQIASRLLNEGKLRHHPLRIMDGGFDTIMDGLQLVSKGQLSGEKIVVRLLN
ncbi:Enoyl reductase [Pyrenophora teres f. teres]|uniref:Enoyl reductase n=1 Tax=Pyrenophora teres f. teres TaxID=97479 RepID=A0A6S6WIB5_9PLEO|nr:Enoyl reductase [Pyrenophora teres f. teres]